MAKTKLRYGDVGSATTADGSTIKAPLLKAFDALIAKPQGAFSLTLIRIGRELRQHTQDANEAARLNALAHKVDELKKGEDFPKAYFIDLNAILSKEFEIEAIRYSEIPNAQNLEPWILIDLGNLLDFDAPGPEAGT